MRILIVKLKHIGDTLLLSPTLAGIKQTYPQARLWVLVRKGTEDMLSGSPYVDRVLTCAEPEKKLRENSFFSTWKLMAELRKQKFDYVFEMGDGDRGRWISLLSGARHRCCSGVALQARPSLFWRLSFPQKSAFPWNYRHRVEKDYYTVADCLPLGAEIPALSFFGERETERLKAMGSFDVIIHPTSRWRRKLWPNSNWILLGKELAARGHRILISCGPGKFEETMAEEIQKGIGSQALSSQGQLTWQELAYLMKKAVLFLGVDTAAMHLSAACQLPSVVLFGPSQVEAWHPWKVNHRVVTAPDKPIYCPLEGSLDHTLGSDMSAISCDSVRRAMEELICL
jgi:heptosyltransferase III